MATSTTGNFGNRPVPVFQVPRKNQYGNSEENPARSSCAPEITSQEQYECNKCGKKYHQLTSFKKHQCPSIVKVCCPSCNKQISKSNISHHMKIHSKPRLKCKQCNKPFKTKETLEKHFQVHSTSGSKQCSACDKTFTRPSHLKTHSKIHEVDRSVSDKSNNFKCKFCDYVASSPAARQVHLSTVHTDRGLKCELCNLVLFTERRFNEHAKKHSTDSHEVEIHEANDNSIEDVEVEIGCEASVEKVDVINDIGNNLI